MQFYFDPVDKACKSVIGGIPSDRSITFKVRSDAKEVYIVFLNEFTNNEKAYPMKKTSDGFFALRKSFKKGLYWYYFVADGLKIGKSKDKTADYLATEKFQLTVYGSEENFSDLLKGGIIYQIFPDRFNKAGDIPVPDGKIKRDDWGGLPNFRAADGKVYNNEFFGGNFKGITQKLEYLKELSVTAVYLNPLSESYSSHRYDTGDYMRFDRVLGSDDDAREMIEKGEKLGISFIFDGVYNHTGADSRYFNRFDRYDSVGAYQSEKSPYHDWFTFNRFPDDYESWWGFKSLPSIAKESKSFQNFITEKVLPRYFRLGFKGVRLDVVDELSQEFVESINKTVRSLDSNAVVIGEVWEDATNKIAYGKRRKYFLGGQLDSVMNYPLKDAIIDYVLHGCTDYITEVMKEQLNNYPKAALDSLMNVLSTHDTSRILTVLTRRRVETDKDLMRLESYEEDELDHGKTLCKIAFVLQFTVYGVPSVYYGDEAGLWGDLDPYNRKCYPWGAEDKDMLSFTRRLAAIRAGEKVFSDGEFSILYAKDKVICYSRKSGDSEIVVALSRYESAVKLRFNGKFENLLTEERSDVFTLSSDDFLILKKCR